MKIIDYSFWNDLQYLLNIFYQFMVLLNYSEQDKESLPAPAPDCLCQAGLPTWSVTPLMNRTSPNILLLCKVLFPGSLHPQHQTYFSMFPCSYHAVYTSTVVLVINVYLSSSIRRET